MPELRERVRARRRPGRRLPARRTPPSTPRGTARPTPPPSCWPTSPTGCPSCSGPSWRRHRWWPRPGATRPRPPWPWPRCCGRAWSSRRGIVVDAASGVSGRRRGPQGHHHLLRGRRGLHRLRPARPPPHPRDRADPGPPRRRSVPDAVRVLFTPHLVPDEPGDPGHLLRPARAGAHRRHRRAAGPVPGGLRRTSRSCVVIEGSPSTKATLGSNTAHVTVRARRAHRLGRRLVRHRQPHQGRLGPGGAVRQPRPGRPRPWPPLVAGPEPALSDDGAPPRI